ncbi:MAG: hypothetical protein ACOYL3_22855 [Desulfuromonadaceae bacterium]
MIVTVLEKLTIADRIISPGEVIDIPESVYPKLAGKVSPVTDGRNLPHYCRPSGSWCSAKLTGTCTAAQCEYREQA